MLDRQDIEQFTARKQELQVAAEILFDESMDTFNLAAFLADPRGYTRAFMETATASVVAVVLPEARQLGADLAAKAAAP